MNPLRKRVDTSIFSSEYDNEMSLGRLYVSFKNRLFSSFVVDGLSSVDPEKFIVVLKNNGFKITILGTYRTIRYPKKENDNTEQILTTDELFVEWEYITMLDGKILMGLRESSFRIVYSHDIPETTIQKITDLYINFNNE